MAEETYADWSVEDLKAEASARDIQGRSSMNKEELVSALEADDAGTGTTDSGATTEGTDLQTNPDSDQVGGAPGTADQEPRRAPSHEPGAPAHHADGSGYQPDTSGTVEAGKPAASTDGHVTKEDAEKAEENK